MKMMLSAILLALLALSNPGQAATVRELDAAELRQAVRGGDILSLKSVIKAVSKSTGGEALEARAFEIDVIGAPVPPQTTLHADRVVLDFSTGNDAAPSAR